MFNKSNGNCLMHDLEKKGRKSIVPLDNQLDDTCALHKKTYALFEKALSGNRKNGFDFPSIFHAPRFQCAAFICNSFFRLAMA